MQVYLVGGAVRDALLGRDVKERDYVVVGATPEQLISQGYQQVGKDFAPSENKAKVTPASFVISRQMSH